jgi:hypothetical protein
MDQKIHPRRTQALLPVQFKIKYRVIYIVDVRPSSFELKFLKRMNSITAAQVSPIHKPNQIASGPNLNQIPNINPMGKARAQ